MKAISVTEAISDFANGKPLIISDSKYNLAYLVYNYDVYDKYVADDEVVYFINSDKIEDVQSDNSHKCYCDERYRCCVLYLARMADLTPRVALVPIIAPFKNKEDYDYGYVTDMDIINAILKTYAGPYSNIPQQDKRLCINCNYCIYSADNYQFTFRCTNNRSLINKSFLIKNPFKQTCDEFKK